MPANLPQQYYKAEEEFKNAKTIPEKIAALEAMMAIMPHHKGTDKLRADLNRRMSQLKEQAEAAGKGKRASLFNVERQGAAQILLIGVPNSGKSSILAAITHAAPLVADYPYTTTAPEIGMMPYRDIQMQIVDLPPMGGDVRKLPFYNLLRTADALALVVDAGGDPGAEVTIVLAELSEGKIFSPLERGRELAIGSILQRVLVVLNKIDAADVEAATAAVRAVIADAIRVVTVSAKGRIGLEELKDELYRVAEIIRVYTKVPGKKADLASPFVLRAGSTVMDLAREIHRDFADGLRFARIWGSGKFEGQQVERDHVLLDGDVIELHI